MDTREILDAIAYELRRFCDTYYSYRSMWDERSKISKFIYGMGGTVLGDGATRIVAFFPEFPDYVFKFAYNSDGTDANIGEHWFYNHIATKEVKNYLAESKEISSDNTILMMEKCIPMRAPFEEYPMPNNIFDYDNSEGEMEYSAVKIAGILETHVNWMIGNSCINYDMEDIHTGNIGWIGNDIYIFDYAPPWSYRKIFYLIKDGFELPDWVNSATRELFEREMQDEI